MYISCINRTKQQQKTYSSLRHTISWHGQKNKVIKFKILQVKTCDSDAKLNKQQSLQKHLCKADIPLKIFNKQAHQKLCSCRLTVNAPVMTCYLFPDRSKPHIVNILFCQSTKATCRYYHFKDFSERCMFLPVVQ